VPRLGAVKQRLAHDIGPRAALRFYSWALARLLRALGRDRRFRTVLAVTPDHAGGRWPPHLPRIEQGPGDLGQRMHRACARFPRGRVAIVGSDIPDVTARDIGRAFALLGRGQAVFGPAMDGGYWLVAMGPRRPSRPFAHVQWSSEYALADTLQNFTRHTICLLRSLHDIDTAEDLKAWRG
jgi:uncharacterized protein